MGRVELGRFVNLISRIELNPLFKKKKKELITQPNLTYQPLNTDPIQWVGLDWVGFNGLTVGVILGRVRFTVTRNPTR